MSTHPQQLRFPKTQKPAPSAQARRGVALFILTLTIMIALIALAPLKGIGQPSGQSTRPAKRLRGKGSVNGSLQPSAPLFLPAVTYFSGGGGAESVAVADVNGDGRPDLIVANTCTNSNCDGSVGVLLGSGNGTFQTAVTYSSGGGVAVTVAVADVNGDGKLDLIVGNLCNNRNCSGSSESGVGVLLGNGDGTFQAALTSPSGGTPIRSVVVADVNRDGRPDLVVLNACASFAECSNPLHNGRVGVLLGNGYGGFGLLPSHNSGGRLPTSIAVADLNGDGNLDVVVANYFSDTLGVLLGRSDGTFKTVVTYSAFSAYSVAIADVDGDGKPDVVVASTSSGSGDGTVGVLLGNGNGTLRPIVTYNAGGYGTTSIAVADVNGDGKPDLLVVNSGPDTVGALLGIGDGTFQAALTYNSGGRIDSSPNSVAVADLNGDGNPDVVVANYFSDTVGVLLNNTGAETTTLSSSLNPSIYGQKVTWTATVTSSGSITPTGKVRFNWSGYTIGSATPNSSGVAILTRSNLNPEVYPLIAVYGGDANNPPSTSTVLDQVVLEATSAATLTSSPNPSAQGQEVTFTATISSPTVIPTGPVTFTAGTTVLGTAQLAGGKAKLVISSLPVGSTRVTVKYNGDSNIAKSSASVIQTVQ
jgi:hypothetical protein